MNQSFLDREVAHLTGESLREVRRRGFSLVITPQVNDSDEPCELPQLLDWDDQQQFERPRRYHRRHPQRAAA